MKTKDYTSILAVIALMLFSAVGVVAHIEHQDIAQEPMPHDMSKPDMSAMMNEPHHALAMVYMQNAGTFAETLHDQAVANSPLDAQLARDAVAEIRRSFDEMETHRGEHMKMMSDEMRTKMAPMMKGMEIHHAMLEDAVSALEKDVAADHIDAKQVAADSATLLEHLDEMSTMHDSKGAKMKM